MQYETIILELLSRIKQLEDEVTLLKQVQSELQTALAAQNDLEDGAQQVYAEEVSGSYKKMTDEMIEICYCCGKRVLNGENVMELADEIAAETGMNRNSAVMYLYAVSAMLQGTVFKRAINTRALKTYFQRIFDEYKSQGLKKALQATKLHIEYRKECGHTVDSIEELYESFLRRL